MGYEFSISRDDSYMLSGNGGKRQGRGGGTTDEGLGRADGGGAGPCAVSEERVNEGQGGTTRSGSQVEVGEAQGTGT